MSGGNASSLLPIALDVSLQGPLGPCGERSKAVALDHGGPSDLREARPTKEMDVLDYGCGTGPVSLFLLPHVRSVTGADNSPGMLDVLRTKIAEDGIENMNAIRRDLEREPIPEDRYHMVVTSMTMHHVADTSKVLRAFHDLLHRSGKLCIADLDTEPGNFHPPEAAGSVHHHGFDREQLKRQLAEAGFQEAHDVTAHTVSRPVEDGDERAFPVFLITASAAEVRKWCVIPDG